MTPLHSKWKTLGIPTILIAIILLVYGCNFTHGFVWWDDQDTIFHNPDFLPPTLKSAFAYWTRLPNETYYYNPVVYTAWALASAVAYDPAHNSLAAWPFHLISLAVHAFSAFIVFRLLIRLTGSHRPLPALIGALVFLLHPVQVEAVAWASGLKDLLCGLFTFLALLAWLNATDLTPSNTPSRRWTYYGLGTTCFILALLSKPLAVIVPLLAGVTEWAAYHTPLRKLAVRLVPWIVISVAAAAFAKCFLPASVVPHPALWARPLLAGDALAFYLYKVSVPWHYAPDYGRRPADVLGTAWVYVAWIVPFAVAMVCAITWRRGVRQFALAFALFVIGVLPVLGLIPFDFQYFSTVSDHYLYVAMFGIAIACAVTFKCLDSIPTRIVTILVLTTFAALSFVQSQYWRDDKTLWTHTIVVNPHSFAGYSQLGFAYWRAQQPEKAAQAYREAIRLNPNHPNGHDLWLYYARKGDLDAAIHEIDQYILAADQLPPLRKSIVPMLYNYKGEMLMVLGRSDEAVAEFQRALEIQPNLEVARQNLLRLRGQFTNPATRPVTITPPV